MPRRKPGGARPGFTYRAARRNSAEGIRLHPHTYEPTTLYSGKGGFVVSRILYTPLTQVPKKGKLNR